MKINADIYPQFNREILFNRKNKLQKQIFIDYKVAPKDELPSADTATPEVVC